MSMAFADMVRAAGLPEKPFYTPAEISRATGVSRSAIYEEIAAGRLAAFLPQGRTRKLIRPEWVDEWMERGTVRAV